MDQGNVHVLSLTQFKNAFKDAPNVGVGDDFYIIDVDIKDSNRVLAHPCRIDGYMFIYCSAGHIKLNVNLQEYDIKSGMLCLNYPGNIIRVNELLDVDDKNLRYTCVVMSREFVGNLLLDINRLFTQNMSLIKNPSLELDDNQRALLYEHVSLMMSIMKSDVPFKVESIRSILSAMFYFVAGVWENRGRENNAKPLSQSSRSRVVFEQFVKLVTEYHTVHRNVGFYSGKLSLTPKYLSRVIRDISGRSAPEWIDDYVILEAKNLLKYSGLAIKEIVFKLNFPSQSVFYKFFKARTGMTPSEYKNL